MVGQHRELTRASKGAGTVVLGESLVFCADEGKSKKTSDKEKEWRNSAKEPVTAQSPAHATSGKLSKEPIAQFLSRGRSLLTLPYFSMVTRKAKI